MTELFQDIIFSPSIRRQNDLRKSCWVIETLAPPKSVFLLNFCLVYFTATFVARVLAIDPDFEGGVCKLRIFVGVTKSATRFRIFYYQKIIGIQKKKKLLLKFLKPSTGSYFGRLIAQSRGNCAVYDVIYITDLQIDTTLPSLAYFMGYCSFIFPIILDFDRDRIAELFLLDALLKCIWLLRA